MLAAGGGGVRGASLLSTPARHPAHAHVWSGLGSLARSEAAGRSARAGRRALALAFELAFFEQPCPLQRGFGQQS